MGNQYIKNVIPVASWLVSYCIVYKLLFKLFVKMGGEN